MVFEYGSSDFVDGDYDMSWVFMGILLIEEVVVDKFIYVYIFNFNKYVMDVFENVDFSIWVNEGDVCIDYLD